MEHAHGTVLVLYTVLIGNSNLVWLLVSTWKRHARQVFPVEYFQERIKFSGRLREKVSYHKGVKDITRD